MPKAEPINGLIFNSRRIPGSVMVYKAVSGTAHRSSLVACIFKIASGPDIGKRCVTALRPDLNPLSEVVKAIPHGDYATVKQALIDVFAKQEKSDD